MFFLCTYHTHPSIHIDTCVYIHIPAYIHKVWNTCMCGMLYVATCNTIILGKSIIGRELGRSANAGYDSHIYIYIYIYIGAMADMHRILCPAPRAIPAVLVDELFRFQGFMH